jgi:hypothetical protein
MSRAGPHGLYLPAEAAKIRTIREPRTRAEWFKAYEETYVGNEVMVLHYRPGRDGGWLLDYNQMNPTEDPSWEAFGSEAKLRAWVAEEWPDIIWRPRAIGGSRVGHWIGLANLEPYDFEDDDE